MTQLLIDTSVILKWFHAEGEAEVRSARSLRDAHVAGEVDAHVLDLGRDLAVSIASQHRLTFYDAAWAAAAQDLGVVLVSADRALLASGLAESPSETAGRLRLS